MDLGTLYNYAINLWIRFLNWNFVVYGVTVHVYSIFIFALLTVVLFKFIDFLRGA